MNFRVFAFFRWLSFSLRVLPVITEFHIYASSRAQNQRRNQFCSLSTFSQLRKVKKRRTENCLGRVEPGNTSLNRRWTLSQPASPDKTHSTKQGRHCSTLVPLHPNSTWLSWWRNGATDNTTSCGLHPFVHCAVWGEKNKNWQESGCEAQGQ